MPQLLHLIFIVVFYLPLSDIIRVHNKQAETMCETVFTFLALIALEDQ